MSNDTFSERLAYPKGLKGIIANESALSDVRGEEGRLLYLGYDIDDLVEMCCFEEVVYLLLNKRLPNREELEGIKKRLRSDRDPAHSGFLQNGYQVRPAHVRPPDGCFHARHV